MYTIFLSCNSTSNARCEQTLPFLVWDLKLVPLQRKPALFTLCFNIILLGVVSQSDFTERFQLKALRMIADTPWYVLNMVIQRVLPIPTVKDEICHYSSQNSACLSTQPNYLPVNLTELPNRRLQRHLQNDLHIRFPVYVFVVLVCKSYSQKPQEASKLLVTEKCLWALFYMPLYKFLHNLLNVLVKIANKMGLWKKKNQ
jgi:hypothetical protein